MSVLLPIASGKGGVGKSVFAANLGVALAEAGKTTVLVDLDLGGANLHTMLGIKNRHSGLGSMIYRHETSLESLVVETGIPRLYFIPGDTLLPGTANLEFFIKQKILRSLNSLPADYVLMDLGAGSSWNTVDFFLSASSGLVVTIPEVTSVLNSYSFIKTALFRALFRAFPAKSAERHMIVDFVSKKIEGTGESFLTLQNQLREGFPQTAPAALAMIQGFYPRVVLNMGKNHHDLAVGAHLRDITSRNLGIPIEYIGFAPRDEAIPRSVAERRPALIARPDSPWAQTLRGIAQRILATPSPAAPRLWEDNEDLITVAEEGLGPGEAFSSIPTTEA